MARERVPKARARWWQNRGRICHHSTAENVCIRAVLRSAEHYGGRPKCPEQQPQAAGQDAGR
jgi:hypothetical protein